MRTTLRQPAPQEGARRPERAIDLVHLARQTLGDPELEAEILALFLVQSRTFSKRIASALDDRARADLAHTLKGSARAVGAGRVARMAERVEAASRPGAAGGLRFAVLRLAHAVEEACAAIEALGPRAAAA